MLVSWSIFVLFLYSNSYFTHRDEYQATIETLAAEQEKLEKLAPELAAQRADQQNISKMLQQQIDQLYTDRAKAAVCAQMAIDPMAIELDIIQQTLLDDQDEELFSQMSEILLEWKKCVTQTGHDNAPTNGATSVGDYTQSSGDFTKSFVDCPQSIDDSIQSVTQSVGELSPSFGSPWTTEDHFMDTIDETKTEDGAPNAEEMQKVAESEWFRIGSDWTGISHQFHQ